MPLIQSPGPTAILNITSTTTGPGSWYRVDNKKLSDLTFQGLHVGTSDGVTVQSTIYIEGSNDGVNAIATKLATFAFNGTTPQSEGATMLSTMKGAWEYIRANVNSASSSTSVSTGYNIQVMVGAGGR
ncbi:MAG: hypothetical protein ACYC36_03570 [Bellilinea sp.]